MEHWLADEVVTAHAEAWLARLGRWVRHHKGLAGSVAAIVALGLTVAIAGWLVRGAAEREKTEQKLRGEAETQRARADRYLYFSRINLAHRAWQEAQITRMDELLEQTQAEDNDRGDHPGFERAYLLRLRQASLWTLKGHTAEILSVAFSPDGQRLASASWDRTVKVWDTWTGQEALTLKEHHNRVYSVAFSPDGQRLASADQEQRVMVWDATPENEGSNLERQALSYFRFIAETVVLKDEMIQQIRQTPTLSEPARQLALAFAKEYREVPDRLTEASESVLSRSWAQPGAYPLALRQAKAACRQKPSNGLVLTTLGVAQYRNGQYAAALKTLSQSEKLNTARYGLCPPADLAFLAMAHFRLGQKAEASASLVRLRDLLKKLPFYPEGEELLKEAESMVDPKK